MFITTKGTWAGCGDPYRMEPKPHRGKGNIIPEKIGFKPLEIARLKTDELKSLKQRLQSYDQKVVIDDEKVLMNLYPPESFTYSEKTILCKVGNYPKQLFEVKKEGVLKAREIF